MTKALFFNVPTSGHVNPSLPLTAELVRRGVQVIYYLTENYRAKVTSTGAEFRLYTGIDDTYFEARGLNGSNPPKAAHDLIETALAVLPNLIKIVQAEKPDVILYDSMCPWGSLVARITDIPSVSSMGLIMLTNAMMRKPRTLLTMLPTVIRGIPHVLPFLQASTRIAQTYHIPALQLPQTFFVPADLTLSYTSAAFQPDAETLPTSIKFVGPSIEQRPHDQDFPFDQLDDRPLIYISLGTVINDNPSFFRDCIQAFRDTPYQVVMAIGKSVRISDLGAVPENFIIRPHVPQLEILERAALFLTHAGINSIHESLYYNVPMVLIPQQSEQNINATRASELHTGITIRNANVTPEGLLTSAEQILKDSSYRQQATRIGETMRNAGGRQRSADLVIELVNKRGSKP